MKVIHLADIVKGTIKPHHSNMSWMSKRTSFYFKVIRRLKTKICSINVTLLSI
jgi:hypothetical protein